VDIYSIFWQILQFSKFRIQVTADVAKLPNLRGLCCSRQLQILHETAICIAGLRPCIYFYNFSYVFGISAKKKKKETPLRFPMSVDQDATEYLEA
jgi:hypothetical protein